MEKIMINGDAGNIEAMIKFVKDYDLKCAAKKDADIKEQRHSYLLKLVEEKIPFAYQELAI